MILKTIKLKEDTPDKTYTEFCNLCERQGVFRACGNCDDKWIMVNFENELDYLAWIFSLSGGTLQSSCEVDTPPPE